MVIKRVEVSVTAKAIAKTDEPVIAISSKTTCPGKANMKNEVKVVNQTSKPLVLPIAPKPTMPAKSTIAGAPAASRMPDQKA